MFFTQDKLDDEGYPVRDPESSSYLATFEPAATFADLVEAEGIRRGAHHIRQLTIVGDGAAWIWDIATGKFSEATQIAGIWHAREHLHDLARVLEFRLGDQRDEWLAARLDDLGHGDIDGICAAAHAYPLAAVKKDEMNKELGYFENNAPACAQVVPLPAACSPAPGRGGRVQGDRRPAPQAIRHEMDRRRRHHRPALPGGQQPMGRDLAAAPQPDSHRLTRP